MLPGNRGVKDRRLWLERESLFRKCRGEIRILERASQAERWTDLNRISFRSGQLFEGLFGLLLLVEKLDVELRRLASSAAQSKLDANILFHFLFGSLFRQGHAIRVFEEISATATQVILVKEGI